jgi:hypothetical protein
LWTRDVAPAGATPIATSDPATTTSPASPAATRPLTDPNRASSATAWRAGSEPRDRITSPRRSDPDHLHPSPSSGP